MANINDVFQGKHLKAGDLKGRTVAVVIDRVDVEPVGMKKEMKPVLYFQGKEKGVVLNVTNARKIAELTGTDEMDEWHGVAIALYPTETSFNGEQVDCIRIRAAKAPTKREPEPPPSDDGDIEADEIPF